MSLAATFQIGALAVSVLFALLRLPLALKGRNPPLFWALVMLSAAIALGITPVYLAVDSFFGGRNIANMFIRFAMFGFTFIIGVKSAVAFRAPLAGRFIGGSVGVSLLLLVSALTVLFFFLADMPESSPGLRDYGDQLPVILYSFLGRAYPAYIAACLVVPALSVATHRRRSKVIRAGAAFLGAGLGIAVLYAVQDLTPYDFSPWDHLLPYSAVITGTAGLALLGSGRVASNRQKKQTKLTQTFLR